MKKYWNRIIFTLFAAAAFTAVSCDDDDEGGKIQENWYANYGYITYKMYPETNVAEPMTATHNAYGVAINSLTGEFKKFQLNLKRAVETDTKFTFTLDPTQLEEGSEMIPLESLLFYTGTYNPEALPEVPNEVVVPAGEKSIEVNVRLKDSEFANANHDAVTFFAPVAIAAIDNKDVKITKNRNTVLYSLKKGAYEKNNVAFYTTEGNRTMTVAASSAEEVPAEMGTFKVKLGYKAVKETKIKFVVDNSSFAADAQIPTSNLVFKVNGAAVENNELVINQSETELQVAVELNDRSFVTGSNYSTTFHIESTSDEEMEIDKTPLMLNITVISVSFTKPTTGHIETDRSNYDVFNGPLGTSLYGSMGGKLCLFNGNTGDYLQCVGYSGWDIVVDLGSEKSVVGFELHGYMDWSNYAVKRYDAVYVGDSKDGPWTKAHDLSTEEDLPQADGPYYVSFGTTKTRWIRIHVREAYGWGAAYFGELYFYVK